MLPTALTTPKIGRQSPLRASVTRLGICWHDNLVAFPCGRSVSHDSHGCTVEKYNRLLLFCCAAHKAGPLVFFIGVTARALCHEVRRP